MKKFCKVLAVIMAVLMLVTMATACKNSDDEFDDVFTSTPGGDEADDVGDTAPGEDGTAGEDDDDSGEKDNGTTGGKDNGTTGGKDNGTTGKKEDDKTSNTPAPSTQDEANKNYDATKKYDMSNNPLLYEGKKANTSYDISFDIDTTGFVKNNIKVADLKGKTFNLITSVMYGVFKFKNEKGEYVSEWDWFDNCKSLYGVNIKYTKSRFDKADQQVLTYMNAGKQLDLVPTHVGGFPKYLNLSQALDPYINVQNLGNSPGVCEMTLEQTKWGGSYRCISAIGAVNVLWYNQSLVEQFNLQDPHKLWKEGNWNWDTYAAFVKSVPKTTPEGKELKAYRQCDGDMFYSWPLTNGLAPIEIDTKSSEPNLINNWLDERTLAAWEFISTTNKSISFGGAMEDMYQSGTLMMSDATMMMPVFDGTDYGKTHKYNWVPFPAATSDTGRCIAFNQGFTMMLPKKMKNQSNAPYAVKFMELWATRFTESLYDFYDTNTSINMDYADKKDHFEFCVKNTYFGVQMNEWDMVTGDNKTIRQQWNNSFKNAQYNVTTEANAMKNIIEQAIKECLIFGA